MGVGVNEHKQFFCFSNEEKAEGKWIKLVDIRNSTKDVIGNRVKVQVEHLMKFLGVNSDRCSVDLGESFPDNENPEHVFYKYIKKISIKYTT